jgi:DNA-binding MarR family transcriptional regulator
MRADLNCTDTKLHHLVRLMGRHYDAELVKVGLRTTQFWLLTEVLQHGPARPCDLAKAMALEPSTLTRKLKPLVATGWLELAFGADRRTRIVCITSSGRIKRAEGLRRWQAAEAHVRELLGAENVNRLDAIIEQSLKTVPCGGVSGRMAGAMQLRRLPEQRQSNIHGDAGLGGIDQAVGGCWGGDSSNP